METTQAYVASFINFLMTRSPLEYTAITGWAMSELLGLNKNTKIKSVLGLAKTVVMAVYNAIKEVELFEQSAQGQAIVAEVKKDIAAASTPAPK